MVVEVAIKNRNISRQLPIRLRCLPIIKAGLKIWMIAFTIIRKYLFNLALNGVLLKSSHLNGFEEENHT